MVDTGVCSDHLSLQVKFRITAIKFKVKEKVKLQVDWTTIGENVETNDLFNVNLFQLPPKDPTYTQFNHCIYKAAGMTAVTTNWKNKGWLHHRRDILISLIEIRDEILTQYHTIGIEKVDTSFT